MASRKHAEHVAEHVVERFLGLGDSHEGEEALAEGATAEARAHADAVADSLAARPPLSRDALEALLARVAARQESVGYDGDYRGWLAKVTPPDLE